MTALKVRPRPVAPDVVQPFAGGVRFVLLSELALWSRRQALDIGLRTLVGLTGVVALLALVALPALGALLGVLGASAAPAPGVVVGLLLLAIATLGVVRLLATLPASRRLAAQRPPDLAVFQALGSHPNSVLAARTTVPAILSATATALFAAGALTGVSRAAGGVGLTAWVAVVTFPAAVALAESGLLRRPPRDLGRRWLGIGISLTAGALAGLGIRVATSAVGTLWVAPFADQAVIGLAIAVGQWVAASVWLLLAAAVLLAVAALLLPHLDPPSASQGQRVAPVARPWGQILRLCLSRSDLPALATHRRLSRAVTLSGWGVLGAGAATLGSSGLTAASAHFSTIGLLAMVAMAMAVSQASGLGLPPLGGALRWLHDAGVPARQVAAGHLLALSRQLLLPLLPAVAGAVLLTRSAVVGVAGIAAIFAAVAAASLGDLIDSTRTTHSDGSGESGVVGGISTALLQALLISPWGGLLTGTGTAPVVAAGIAAPALALTLAAIITTRRIHP